MHSNGGPCMKRQSNYGLIHVAGLACGLVDTNVQHCLDLLTYLEFSKSRIRLSVPWKPVEIDPLLQYSGTVWWLDH